MFENAYNRAWKSIIQPRRLNFMALPQQKRVQSKTIQIDQFQVLNREGKTISAFILKQKKSIPKKIILYFHGNGGSKHEALTFMNSIAQDEICVISFDYLGCGKSQDGYLTYGISQLHDVWDVYLQSKKRLTYLQKVTLWGRSMGSLTAIMFAQKHYQIVQKIVLDGPFRKLEDIVKAILKKQTSLPNQFINIAFHFIKKQVESRLNYPLFQIDYLERLKSLETSRIPVLFFYSKSDQIVNSERVQEMFFGYKGLKQDFQIFHEHYQDRSFSVIDQGVKWIIRQFRTKSNKINVSYRQIEKKRKTRIQITERRARSNKLALC